MVRIAKLGQVTGPSETDGGDEALSWQSREGRLMVYELFIRGLLANQKHHIAIDMAKPSSPSSSPNSVGRQSRNSMDSSTSRRNSVHSPSSTFSSSSSMGSLTPTRRSMSQSDFDGSKAESSPAANDGSQGSRGLPVLQPAVHEDTRLVLERQLSHLTLARGQPPPWAAWFFCSKVSHPDDNFSASGSHGK